MWHFIFFSGGTIVLNVKYCSRPVVDFFFAVVFVVTLTRIWVYTSPAP
jgi:hypothetical protein